MFKRVKAVIFIFFLGFILSMGIVFAGAPIKLDQFGDLGEIIGLEFYNENYIFLISRKKLFVFIRENNESDIFPALQYRDYELSDDAIRAGFSRKKQRIMIIHKNASYTVCPLDEEKGVLEDAFETLEIAVGGGIGDIKKASVDAYSGVIIVPGVEPNTLFIRDYDCNSHTECEIGFIPQEGSSIYMTPNYRQLLHIQEEVFHVWGNNRLRSRLYLWEYEYRGKLFGLGFRNKPIKYSTVSESKDRIALSLDDGQVLIFQRNISNARWSMDDSLLGAVAGNPVASFRHSGEGKINFVKFGHKDQYLLTLQHHVEASKSTVYIWRRQHKHELNLIKGNLGGNILYPVEEYPWLTDTSTVLNFDMPMLQAALSPCGRYVVTVSTAELQIWRVPQE